MIKSESIDSKKKLSQKKMFPPFHHNMKKIKQKMKWYFTQKKKRINEASDLNLFISSIN